MGPIWQLKRPRADRVEVVFSGHLTGVEGQLSAAAFRRELDRGPCHVEWNVAAMTGYDSEARVAWQQAMWPVRKNVTGVVVRGANRVIRFGARVLTAALGVPCSFVDEPVDQNSAQR